MTPPNLVDLTHFETSENPPQKKNLLSKLFFQPHQSVSKFRIGHHNIFLQDWSILQYHRFIWLILSIALKCKVVDLRPLKNRGLRSTTWKFILRKIDNQISIKIKVSPKDYLTLSCCWGGHGAPPQRKKTITLKKPP